MKQELYQVLMQLNNEFEILEKQQGLDEKAISRAMSDFTKYQHRQNLICFGLCLILLLLYPFLGGRNYMSGVLGILFFIVFACALGGLSKNILSKSDALKYIKRIKTRDSLIVFVFLPIFLVSTPILSFLQYNTYTTPVFYAALIGYATYITAKNYSKNKSLYGKIQQHLESFNHKTSPSPAA